MMRRGDHIRLYGVVSQNMLSLLHKVLGVLKHIVNISLEKGTKMLQLAQLTACLDDGKKLHFCLLSLVLGRSKDLVPDGRGYIM